MSHNLFTYGSLMFPEVWCFFQKESTEKKRTATLKKFRCLTVKNEVFPAIIPAEDNSVKGVLYYDIDEQTLSKIDLFEGDLYLRKQVTVTDDNNNPMEALTYILSPEYYHLSGNSSWNEKEFKSLHLSDFIKECFRS